MRAKRQSPASRGKFGVFLRTLGIALTLIVVRLLLEGPVGSFTDFISVGEQRLEAQDSLTIMITLAIANVIQIVVLLYDPLSKVSVKAWFGWLGFTLVMTMVALAIAFLVVPLVTFAFGGVGRLSKDAQIVAVSAAIWVAMAWIQCLMLISFDVKVKWWEWVLTAAAGVPTALLAGYILPSALIVIPAALAVSGPIQWLLLKKRTT